MTETAYLELYASEILLRFLGKKQQSGILQFSLFIQKVKILQHNNRR